MEGKPTGNACRILGLQDHARVAPAGLASLKVLLLTRGQFERELVNHGSCNDVSTT